MGQILSDIFATDQSTDYFALTQYNDRNRPVPTLRLGHHSTFFMLSFALKQLIHTVYPYNFSGFLSIELKVEFADLASKNQSIQVSLKKVKILDFLKLGQRRLETFGMILVDRKNVLVVPFSYMEVSCIVYWQSGMIWDKFSLTHFHRPFCPDLI